MSTQTSGAPPLEVAVVRPALANSPFYQMMMTIRVLGTVAPDNMQLDQAMERKKQEDNLAKATLRVQSLKKRKSDKDALADIRYNFCHQKFLDNCVEDKDAKYFKPKYYVRMLEKEENREKGSLDRFLHNGKMEEWIDRFEGMYAQPIPANAVCDICKRGDGKIFICEAHDDETGAVCNCTQHAGCAGYAPGQEPSEALCANEYHEEQFHCKKHFGNFLLSRNSEPEKAAEAERDAELIDAAEAREHFKIERKKRRELNKHFFNNSKNPKNLIQKIAKRKVPEAEAPKTLLISNGGPAGASHVDRAGMEVVPDRHFMGQWKWRLKWTFEKYYKKITKNKDKDPHVIVMMHPDSSLFDVKEWHDKFARQWHPDKNPEASDETKAKMNEMFGIFKGAIELFRKSIKRTKKRKDRNADKYDAEILKQQKQARSSDDSDDDEETTDDEGGSDEA